MNYEQEIRYREEILERVRGGVKATPEERLWLATHRVYNRALGYPYVNADILNLQPDVGYRLRITLVSVDYPGRINPVISVPGNKGEILVTTGRLTDIDGKPVPVKPVKVLGVLIGPDNKTSEVYYRSKLGLLGIGYECEYYDDKQHLMIRSSSCTGVPSYAMLPRKICENKILYTCKSPISDNLDCFSFSVEWEREIISPFCP